MFNQVSEMHFNLNGQFFKNKNYIQNGHQIAKNPLCGVNERGMNSMAQFIPCLCICERFGRCRKESSMQPIYSLSGMSYWVISSILQSQYNTLRHVNQRLGHRQRFLEWRPRRG